MTLQLTEEQIRAHRKQMNEWFGALDFEMKYKIFVCFRELEIPTFVTAHRIANKLHRERLAKRSLYRKIKEKLWPEKEHCNTFSPNM